MKACKHFKKAYGQETEIIRSNHPWNAWVAVYRGDQLIHKSFETGLRWDYLTHLSQSETCRREIGISLEEVNRLLREIEEEWEKRMEPKIKL
jgi:hypothetical protein